MASEKNIAYLPKTYQSIYNSDVVNLQKVQRILNYLDKPVSAKTGERKKGYFNYPGKTGFFGQLVPIGKLAYDSREITLPVITNRGNVQQGTLGDAKEYLLTTAINAETADTYKYVLASFIDSVKTDSTKQYRRLLKALSYSQDGKNTNGNKKNVFEDGVNLGLQKIVSGGTRRNRNSKHNKGRRTRRRQ